MADEAPTEMVTDSGETPQAQAQPQQAQTTPTQPGEMPDVAQLQAQLTQMQDALKKANREAAERRKKLDGYESAEAARKEAEMSETDKLNKRLADAEKRAKEAELQLLRRDVAAKYALPAALVDRLRGSDMEELEEDAKSLVAALPKPPAPNINSGTGNGRVPTPGVMDEQAKRELAAVLNVNPKYL